jgi:hypothetical protein
LGKSFECPPTGASKPHVTSARSNRILSNYEFHVHVADICPKPIVSLFRGTQ